MVECQTRVSPTHAGFVFVGAAVDSVLGCVGVETPHPVARLHEVLPDLVAVTGGAGGTAGSRPGVTQFNTPGHRLELRPCSMGHFLGKFRGPFSLSPFPKIKCGWLEC